MSTLQIATAILKLEEGFKGHIYDDHLGNATIGYGQLLSKSPVSSFPADFPNMPEPVALAWLEHNTNELVEQVQIDFPTLDCVRQAVIVSMMYQIGVSGFWRFAKTIESVHCKDYEQAAEHMLDSLWAKQTPDRARRHSIMMFTGVTNKIYKVK